jgi:hypothetical protein
MMVVGAAHVLVEMGRVVTCVCACQVVGAVTSNGGWAVGAEARVL